MEMEINPAHVVENQNLIELRGTTAFNAEAASTSCSRGQMQASAVSQHYVISGNEPNTIQTGAEQEYGKATYSIQAEHNVSKVVAVVDRYFASGINGIGFNPQRIVIYETYDESPDGKPVYGIIDIPHFSCKHTQFGFQYKATANVDYLRVGEAFNKGTVFYDTPAKDSLGNYNMGLSLKTAYVSLPGTVEDLIMISKTAFHKMSGRKYTEHEMEAGEAEYFLNTYGDNKQYKIMPDIGEYTNPNTGYSGMLLAKRPYMNYMMPITFTPKSTATFDPMTDIALDGNGPNGRVVDIIVYRNSRGNSPMQDCMTEQLTKYEQAYVDFCNRVLTEYGKIKRMVGGNPHVTDEFSNLLKHCMAITNRPPANHAGKSPHVQKVGNFNRRLDDYYIKIVVEHIVTPNVGYKITDLHG